MRLNKRFWNQLLLALDWAKEDRQALADAWQRCEKPCRERQDALEDIETCDLLQRFLRQELAKRGQRPSMTWDDWFDKLLEGTESLTLHEIMQRVEDGEVKLDETGTHIPKLDGIVRRKGLGGE